MSIIKIHDESFNFEQLIRNHGAQLIREDNLYKLTISDCELFYSVNDDELEVYAIDSSGEITDKLFAYVGALPSSKSFAEQLIIHLHLFSK